MRATTAIYVAILLSSLTSVFCFAAEDRVSVARQQFTRQMYIIDEASDERSDDWPAKYLKELRALETKVQAQANLEGLIAVKKEISRFETSHNIPEESVVVSPAALHTLQQKYRKMGGGLDIEKCRGIVSLVKKYVVHLEALKTGLTKSGDVGGALAAKAEIERVNTSELVINAKAAVAAVSRSTPRTAPAGIGVGPHGVGGVQTPVAATEEKPSGPPGYVIYPQGETPARKTGEIFTRLAVNDSGNTPLSSRKVSVIAYRRADTAAPSPSSSPYGSSRTSNSSTVRLFVRHTNTSTVLEDQIVNIQFFTKSTRGRGNIVPVISGSGSVKVPKLTSAGIWMDCPEVTATSSSSSYRYYQGRSSYHEFYGVLVNVYNADGTLSFQGLSTSGLKDLAAAAKTRSARDMLAEQVEASRIAYETARQTYYTDTSNPALRDAYSRAQQEHYALQTKLRSLGR